MIRTYSARRGAGVRNAASERSTHGAVVATDETTERPHGWANLGPGHSPGAPGGLVSHRRHLDFACDRCGVEGDRWS